VEDTRTAGRTWYAIRRGVDSALVISFDGTAPLTLLGDYCSIACVAERAAEISATLEEARERARAAGLPV